MVSETTGDYHPELVARSAIAITWVPIIAPATETPATATASPAWAEVAVIAVCQDIMDSPRMDASVRIFTYLFIRPPQPVIFVATKYNFIHYFYLFCSSIFRISHDLSFNYCVSDSNPVLKRALLNVQLNVSPRNKLQSQYLSYVVIKCNSMLLILINVIE